VYKVFLPIIIYFSVFLFIVAVSPDKMITDEPHHIEQIHNFLNNDFTIINKLTVFPGYHYLFSLVLRLLNNFSLQFIRTINLLIAFLVSVVFYFLQGTIKDSKDKLLNTFQLMTLPLFIPYAVLVYTDNLGILFLLLFFLFTKVKKRYLSLFFMLLTLFVRQDYIIMIIMILVLNSELINKLNSHNLKEFVLENLLNFAVIFSYTLIFITVFGNIAIGDKSNHPFPYFGIYNITFFFFTFMLIFPLVNLHKLIDLIKKKEINKTDHLTFIVFFIMIIAERVFFHGELNNYNTLGISVTIRNALIHYLENNHILYVTYAAVVSCGLVIFNKFLSRKELILIFLALIVFNLLPRWLIEVRYYLPILILFSIYKMEIQDKYILIAQSFLNVLLSVGIILMSYFSGNIVI
jgi:hypothetical protein